ncbi:MAG: hypothetical protein ABIZ91_09215, partial [Gemmatimonadaceae bacterium]
MLSPHSSPTLRALLDQGRLAEARGRHLEARELYECGLHSLAPASAPEMAVQLLIAVGRTHLASGSIGPAREVVEAAIALAQAPGLEGALATALAARGRMRRLEGELVAAQADFVAARHHALSVTRHDVAALSASELATLAELRGVTDEAVQHMEIAVSDFRAASDHAGAARALERLASLYAFLKRWNAAEQAFAEAAAPAPGEGEDARIAELELARADMALDRANVERASASATRALEAARRAGEGALVARAVLLQGIVARETGDLPLAQQTLEHAYRQAQSREDLLLQAEVAKEIADLFARQERHGQALHALDRAYRALIQLRGRELAPA